MDILVKQRHIKHLHLPDPHATPEWNNDRFEWAGELIMQERPDVIICAGDFGDVASLCHHDDGTAKAEGRRFMDDVESVIDAQTKLFKAMKKYNAMRSKNKKVQYKPRLVLTLGNHENRVNKYCDNNPKLAGAISVEQFQFRRFGWEVIPYKQPIDIDGVAYCHHFSAGQMDKPIGGEMMARALVLKKHMSCTVGHSHIYQHHSVNNAMGRKIHGLSGGVFSDEFMGYAGNANELWDRGLTIKYGVNQGDYSHRFVTMEEIKRGL